MHISAGKLWGLRRMADAGGRFKMTAVDQRPPIKNPIKAFRGTAEAPWEDVAGFKRLLIEELQSESSAMLLDPHYAYPAGISVFDPAKGLIVTLEDSVFEESPGGRLSAEIDGWSVEKIKRIGGDAVKVLAWYRPDAEANVVARQKDFAKRVGEACARYDIPYVFELLVYPLARDREQTGDYVEMKGKKAEHVLASVETFAHADYGIDVFKLESPVSADAVAAADESAADDLQRVFDEMGRRAGRPWVMLSAGAGQEAFRRILVHAYRAGASGYLAGRAIWLESFAAFPDWQAIRDGLRQNGIPYMRQLNALTDAEALPFHRHPCFAPDGPGLTPADASFRHAYAGFGG